MCKKCKKCKRRKAAKIVHIRRKRHPYNKIQYGGGLSTSIDTRRNRIRIQTPNTNKSVVNYA